MNLRLYILELDISRYLPMYIACSSNICFEVKRCWFGLVHGGHWSWSVVYTKPFLSNFWLLKTQFNFLRNAIYLALLTVFIITQRLFLFGIFFANWIPVYFWMNQIESKCNMQPQIERKIQFSSFDGGLLVWAKIEIVGFHTLL